eukprot:3468303-Lingulodinium_polyedra.AAC.1
MYVCGGSPCVAVNRPTIERLTQAECSQHDGQHDGQHDRRHDCQARVVSRVRSWHTVGTP